MIHTNGTLVMTVTDLIALKSAIARLTTGWSRRTAGRTRMTPFAAHPDCWADVAGRQRGTEVR